MTKRCVAQIVGQGHGFGQFDIQAQNGCNCTGDLTHFYRVGQASAKQAAFVRNEHLGFVHQAAECGGVNDTIAVALKARAVFGF